MGKLRSYPENVKFLCSGLHKDDAELSDTLVTYSNFLIKRVNWCCAAALNDPDDVLQQLLIRLLKYSSDYKRVGVCSWKGERFKITDEYGNVVRIIGRRSEKSSLIRKEVLDITKKLSYTNFIKLKIQQELSNIKSTGLRKKNGYNIDHISLDDEDVVLSSVIPDAREKEPDKVFLLKEEREVLSGKLSDSAKRFLDSVDYESTLFENKLVRSLRMSRRRLLFAKREVKNIVFGTHKSKNVFPIQLSAGAVKW